MTNFKSKIATTKWWIAVFVGHFNLLRLFALLFHIISSTNAQYLWFQRTTKLLVGFVYKYKLNTHLKCIKLKYTRCFAYKQFIFKQDNRGITKHKLEITFEIQTLWLDPTGVERRRVTSRQLENGSELIWKWNARFWCSGCRVTPARSTKLKWAL